MQNVRKPHERPSIGVLLCASKDNEVVEYALSRSVSPTLVAEYQTRLPDRKVLQAKLHEFYKLTSSAALSKQEGSASEVGSSGAPEGEVPRTSQGRKLRRSRRH
jgi:hypothetical protein